MTPKLVNSDQEFKKTIEEYLSNNTVQSMLILMAENNRCDIDYIETIIKGSTKTILGGMFPKIIFEDKLMDDGIMIIPLKFALRTVSFDFNTSDNYCYDKMKSILTSDTHKVNTMFMFFDALSDKKDAFVNCLFNYFGTTVRYIGSACGTSHFKHVRCVISNAGFTQNSGVFAVSEEEISSGSSHGFQPISSIFKVTEVEDNVIKTLDWMPAFDVYNKIVNKHSNQNFTDENFLKLSKLYPLGKTKIDGDFIIRSVIEKEGNNLKSMDLVEAGEHVLIMSANKEQMLSATKEALNVVLTKSKVSISEDTFIFYVGCLLRELILEDEFQEEIDIIAKKFPVYGVLSLGEIENSGDRVLEIYNDIIALALWK